MRDPVGKERMSEVQPHIGAEDFAVFAERVPGLVIKPGIRNEAGGITAATDIPEFDTDEVSARWRRLFGATCNGARWIVAPQA